MNSNASFVSSWISYIWLTFIRPFIKGFLRKTTGLCELQRICYATRGSSAERTMQIEQSLLLSRAKVIQRVRDKLIYNPNPVKSSGEKDKISQEVLDDENLLINFAVEAICLEKCINTKIHKEFVIAMNYTLTQIYQYKKMTEKIVSMTRIPYDKENSNHRKLLLRLWNALKPEKATSVVGLNWTSIGFQGNDPSTDFRGMGILGLEQLVYFAEEFPETALSVLSVSSHPTKGYPFAITGINLTHLTVKLMMEGILKTHYYNLVSGPALEMTDVNLVYAYIFSAFNSFWLKENPSDIMEFRVIRDKFTHQLVTFLITNPDCTLMNWTSPVVERI